MDNIDKITIVSNTLYFQGYVYQVDQWEVPRDLIEKGEELGSGSFGVCHRGVYTHPEQVIV